MKVLITGANGFVGKNLQLHLAERKMCKWRVLPVAMTWPSCPLCCRG
jgi:nucleoside-diphosphate-sugar epimerase